MNAPGIEARVAEVLGAHVLIYENDGGDYGGRSWFECSCDERTVLGAEIFATEVEHHIHVAAALAPLIAEVRAGALREVGEELAERPGCGLAAAYIQGRATRTRADQEQP